MATGKDSIFSGKDVQFLLTFAAGMGGFWLSGHLPAYIPAQILPHGATTLMVLAIGIALVIYGLGMFVWSLLLLGRGRSVRAALIAALVTMILALITTLTLSHTGAGLAHTSTQLALLVFILYVVYGAYYVIGLFVARRLAK